MRIELLKEVDSTNDYIKKYLDGGENVIVCAERQTKGRGTKGRSFLSDAGGVYLTALIFHENLPAREAFRVMAHAAVAVCRTISGFGVEPSIKWPNDVLIGGRKCCGILIENKLLGDKIRASIIGIGVDVSNDLSELDGIAHSLGDFLKECPSVEEVRERLIREICRESTFEEYLSFVGFLGREITVSQNGVDYLAVAQRILPDGRLEIRKDGENIALSAAEISIRFCEVQS